jgi:hypothetical protein
MAGSCCKAFWSTGTQGWLHYGCCLRTLLLQAYGCEDPAFEGQVFCMALGQFVRSTLVVAAHLFKYAWSDRVYKVMGFPHINDVGNGLMLIK